MVDIGGATERAMEQARRAGLTDSATVVESVTADGDGDLWVYVRSGRQVYTCCVGKRAGEILLWSKGRSRPTK
jgi:hypothetical protein